MNTDELLELCDQAARAREEQEFADLVYELSTAAIKPREQIAELCSKAAELLEQMRCNERRYRWIREHPYFAEEQTLSEEELDKAIDDILAGTRMDPDEEYLLRQQEIATRKPYKPEYEYPHCAPMDPPRPLFE